MLTKLAVKNFKAHADTDLDLKPITVFIGPNNSGKSTIFQLLLLFKEKLYLNKEVLYSMDQGSFSENTNDSLSRLVDLGSKPQDMINDILRGISIEIKGNALIKDTISKRIGFKEGYSEVFYEFDEELKITKCDYYGKMDNEYIIDIRNKDALNDPNMNITVQNSDVDIVLFYSPNFLRPTNHYNVKVPDRNDEKRYSHMAKQMLGLFENLVRSWTFIYGIRGFETHTQELINGWSKERTEYLELDIRSKIISAMMLSNKDVADKISRWFKELLEIDVYAELVGDKRSILKIRSDKNNLLINEGLGSQQMLHMLIPIALSDELDTILIEEPEIHLHPRTQSDLMKLFIKVWKDENKQIIFSTHSEHMIYPILSSISRGELKKEDVAIIYFEMKDGAVRTSNVEINDRGMVKGGLPGFFEADLLEMKDFFGDQ